MKMKELHKLMCGSLVLLATTLGLSACSDSDSSGSSSSAPTANSSSVNDGAGAPDGQEGSCDAETIGVNWNALMTKTCPNLSDYNLFKDSSDPTDNPNTGGMPYGLSTALFTDYATKYRYVFVPEGEKAEYTENEVLDFPVGTVLVKTFALPENTAFRDGAETVIETRLLVHRESGWKALPYYWDTENDASLAITGKSIANMTTNHNGVDLNFTYQVPKATSCTSCHSVVPILQGPDDRRQAIFKPIGPKARFLNRDFDYADSSMNQLVYWQEQGILDNLPADLSTVSKAPVFDDSTDIGALTAAEVDDAAKAYLDINCAHCHRSELSLPEPNYAGPAGSSGVNVEYNRVYADNPTKFGTCKVPVAGGHEDYSADVVPQDAGDSYLLFRMSTNDQRHRMPELGRSTVHQEGVDLIAAWINGLPAASCTP
ncbi:SO2930 family diheme c-type cytochrome [Litoribacillus peritrichatus]|uniref:Cytochrome c domain-containing protein n=1 Tax=Litoribacillus peritrichatus TaxID=718191 RepID=A0ABP7M4B7_9GAMM